MPLDIAQFPCLADNYGYLVHDAASGETIAIDTPDAEAYLAEAARRGWRITQIWNTHWHADHAGGNLAIKAAMPGCRISAPAGDAARIAGVDRTVDQGDTLALGAFGAQVINVGGHTLGHVAYYLPEAGVAFVGDTLFALGCGRMFEGTPEQFWASLARLKALPADTLLYCAHEYTQGNARFAAHVDPGNAALAAYVAEVAERRAQGLATVPFPLARELACNPFLRADEPAFAAPWGDTPASAFAALRLTKDQF